MQNKIKRMGRVAVRPLKCDCCDSNNVALVKQKEAYGSTLTNQWPWIWYCADCRASVGCHVNTSQPLGTMADKCARRARYRTHIAFDPMWKSSKWLTRDMAYIWLASCMGIKSHKCHIALFSYEQCVAAITICKTHKPKKKHFRQGHLYIK